MVPVEEEIRENKFPNILSHIGGAFKVPINYEIPKVKSAPVQVKLGIKPPGQKTIKAFFEKK